MLTQEDLQVKLSEVSSPTERIDLLNSYSWDIRRSYPKEALEAAKEARDLSEKINYLKGIAESYRNSGTAFYLLSQYNAGLSDLQKALVLFWEQEDKLSVSTVIRNIGNIYHSLHQYQKSLDAYFEALNLADEAGDKQGVAYTLGNIGYVYQKIGNYEHALDFITQAVEKLRHIKDRLGLADALNNLGNTYILLKDLKKPLPLFSESLNICAEINHIRGIANCNSSVGSYYYHIKDFLASKTFYEAASNAAHQMGEKQLIYQIYKDLSRTYKALGEIDKSFEYLEKYDELKTKVLTADNEISLKALQAQLDLVQKEKENQVYKLKNIELAKAYSTIEEKNKELERLSIVASETHNVILVLDKVGKLEWVNDSFEKLNGITLENLVKLKGETIFDVSNNPRIHDIFDQCLKQRDSVTYESLNITEDGRRIWESSTLTPIFDIEGNLYKYIIIDTDITDRKLQEEIINQKNKDITDSINYARKIQDSLLPPKSILENAIKDSFVLYKPKDIVSGDFYWFNQINDVLVIAAVDCTGHGVPGAFMSVIGNNLLNEVVFDKSIVKPSMALKAIDEKLFALLNSNRPETSDGMDIALCAIHLSTGLVQYSGANRPLWLFRNSELIEKKPDKISLGGKSGEAKKFTDYEFQLEPGDTFYIFTDGYADQFGGNDKKKLMSKNLKKLFSKLQEFPMSDQKQYLDTFITDWRGGIEQIDDILIIGIRA